MTTLANSKLTLRRSRHELGLPSAVSLAGAALLTPIYLAQGLLWPQAVAAAVIVVLPGVVLGWAIWQYLIEQRVRPFRWRTPAAHMVLAIGFSLAWTVSIIVLAYFIHREAAVGFLRSGALWQLFGGLVVYAAIAAGARSSVVRSRLKEQELALARLELQALRARLDPHFLFNTLHSLTQLAAEDPGATQDALERFGELMRYVLTAGKEAGIDATLEEELHFVRHYLALERLRLGDRLQVAEEIDPDALELAVPPLLLQPLVENAVRHGLAPRRAGGTIRLGARLNQNRLIVTVSDNGNGMASGAWHSADGLGLKAVRRQLEARFPGANAFRVHTRPGAGFAVSIGLPARLPEKGST
jgi:signal transduction histidine kinase